MGVFVYNAIDRAGRVVTGKMEGDSREAIQAKLQGMSLHIIDIGEQRTKVRGVSLKSRAKKVKMQDLALFSRQFSTMVNSGIPLIRCLGIMEGQTKEPVLKEVVGNVRQQVTAGSSLTDAFAKHTNIFSKLYVSMIHSAEMAGVLGEILDRLSIFLENEVEIRAKIKSAMIYPIAVLCFAVVLVGVMMVVVLPTFKGIFTDMNVPMPATTKALFAVSGFMVKFWYILIGSIVGACLGVKYYGKTDAGRRNLDLFKLKFPVIGELVQKMSISRFARTFSTLIGSGVPIMRALEVVSDTSGNVIIEEAINNARINVREGQKISAPLAASGMFPEMVTQMIDIGEESGKLGDMLTRVADFYDKEVDHSVKALTSLIEPALIIIMGSLVGFIAISILSPIFTLAGNIK